MTLVNAETGEIVGRSLVECEQVIERGLTTFIEAARMLMGPTSARPLPPMGGGPHPGQRDGTG